MKKQFASARAVVAATKQAIFSADDDEAKALAVKQAHAALVAHYARAEDEAHSLCSPKRSPPQRTSRSSATSSTFASKHSHPHVTAELSLGCAQNSMPPRRFIPGRTYASSRASAVTESPRSSRHASAPSDRGSARSDFLTTSGVLDSREAYGTCSSNCSSGRTGFR